MGRADPSGRVIAHESSGLTHSDPFIWAGPPDRTGPFDSSTHKAITNETTSEFHITL